MTEIKAEFPGVDYSLVTDEEDKMFYRDKENDELCKKRGVKFLQWLCGRPEIHIAVVTHSVFLKNLFSMFGSAVSEADREAIHKFPANAEMRSIMLCAHRKFPSTATDVEMENAEKRRDVALWNGSM